MAKGQHDVFVDRVNSEVTEARVAGEQAYPLSELEQRRLMANLQGRVDTTWVRCEAELLQREALRVELALTAEEQLEAMYRKQRDCMLAEAEAAARIMVAGAEAGATVAIGDARATAVLRMGEALAEVMELRAEAYALYTPAALLDHIVESLVPLAEAFVVPLQQISSATVITDGTHGAGTALITAEVAAIMQQLGVLIKAYTGLDMMALLRMVPDTPQMHLQKTRTHRASAPVRALEDRPPKSSQRPRPAPEPAGLHVCPASSCEIILPRKT